MESVIRLLPEALANQIAAGEVVQRPASIVKELLENSIDAKASEIHLVVKEAGKTLVKVMDNGQGMSAQDARMAFEKHATSKIEKTDDLFNIRTLGFRGEAMASIGAVAQVEMRTRLHNQELGTRIRIEGSEVIEVEPDLTSKGTSISVKNLFFNVPARRNFLKSNPVEIRHILNEFIRISLANPKVKFTMVSGGESVYQLPPQKLEDRIAAIFGKKFNGNLIWVKEETSYINIQGFIGSPEVSRRARGDQFFFVNNRFFKSPYLNHAINRAFEDILPKDKNPFYCLFFEIEPRHVDINIHPTKTEVKFDDESNVYAFILSVVRKGIGTSFLPVSKEETQFRDSIKNTLPNFEQDTTIGQYSKSRNTNKMNATPEDWDKLYSAPKRVLPQHVQPPSQKQLQDIFSGMDEGAVSKKEDGRWAQIYGSYILGEWDGKVLIVNQNLAHQRILFERYLNSFSKPPGSSQQLLFPLKLQFSLLDYSSLKEVLLPLRHLGFDIHEFSDSEIIVHGLPSGVKAGKVEELLGEIIDSIRDLGEIKNLSDKLNEKIVSTIARKSAIRPHKTLEIKEMKVLVEDLFSCREPGLTPSGKPTFFTLEHDFLMKFFQENK